MPIFSIRTSWQRQPNRLTEILRQRRERNEPVFDLTLSNPTECALPYPEAEILAALSGKESLRYTPDPSGLLSAREAVAAFYARKAVHLDPANIILTASTSEAYSLLFRLLCNSSENLLIPSPSYPLVNFLAQTSDVALAGYHLLYDGEWHIDFESVERALTPATKAIILINPHNPTGMFLKRTELERLTALALKHDLALIVDEVFSDYPLNEERASQRVQTTAGAGDVLTFTLNGISKMLGLPQLKLGWIALSGPPALVEEARARLELLCDTFLSVNTPVQAALPLLLQLYPALHTTIAERVCENYHFLTSTIVKDSSCSLLSSEGGWYAILRTPRVKTDEEWAIELLEREGVYVYPGYFFDFEDDGYLVVSLLPEGKMLREGVGRMGRVMERQL